MNVLLLIDSLKFGGAERQFAELIRGLNSIDELKLHVGIFEERKEGFLSDILKLKIPLTLFKRECKYDVTLFRKLNRYVKGNDIDLINSFSLLAGIVSVIYSKYCRVPVVASTIRNSKDTKRIIKYSIMIQSILADRFISNSHAGFKNRFKKVKRNYRVVYNGIDLKRYTLDKKKSIEIRRRYLLDNYEYVITMIASLTDKKDHNSLLNAFSKVLLSIPKTILLIVGDGPERARVERKAYDLNLGDNVIFTGYIYKVKEILANSHISVLMSNPRKHLEGIPNCLLESMAMGVPVIASKGGGTDEVIDNLISGVLVEPKDTQGLANWIIRLLKDDSLKNKLAEGGRIKIAEKFSYERYINEYVCLYKELVKNKNV